MILLFIIQRRSIPDCIFSVRVVNEMQKTPEIEIEANLVRIRNEQISGRVLQVIIISHAKSPRNITSIVVRHRDGTIVNLAELGNYRNLLPFTIKPGETETLDSLSHESLKKEGAVIVVEDDLHKEYSFPVGWIGNPDIE